MTRIIILLIISLSALGLVLFLLFNKKQKPWDQMTDEEQNRKKVMMAGGLTVFIAGIISALMLAKKK